MGTTVLDASVTAPPGLYLYAHCLSGHPGGVALLAINADRDHARDLALPTDSTRYSLTANDPLSSTALLNGAELKVTADGDLPVLEGAPQPAGDVSLPAGSITFFAIPKAHNAACH